MPYSCAIVGGRPMLTPAQEQSHTIVGQREQRSYTACSPVNPDMCRTWTVHRFDLDCDGARIPWISVVGAAADQADGRAWAEGGRLRLRMGWQWGMAPDDPCARGPGFDDRFGFGRMRRYCADRRAMMPPPIVEMPFGFAPMLGIDGIFVKAGTPGTSAAPSALPPTSAVPAPPKTARIDPVQPSRPEPPFATRPPDLSRDAASRDVPAVLVPPQATDAAPKSQTTPQIAAPLPVSPPVPQPAAPPAPKAPPAPQAAVQPAAPKPAPPPPAAAPTVPSSGPVVPKIINRPDPTPPDASGSATTTVAKAEPGAEPPLKVVEAPPPRAAVRPDPPAANATAEREDASVTVSLLSAARSPVTGAIAVFAGLTFGLLTAFVVARRRERVRFAGAQPRDIGSVSLHGKATRPRPVARLGFSRGQVPPNDDASAMHRVPVPGHGVPGEEEGIPANWGNAIPQTREEALEILGMGVTHDASDAAIKKIVDGLRLSWHPDHARDEADRQLRELRLKQINVAWEIIQGRRGQV